MSENEIIREAIRSYLKHHKEGKFEDLIRYLMKISTLNKKIQEISWDLEEITKKVLLSFSKNKFIDWDEESEKFELINNEIFQDIEETDEKKRIEYNYFSSLEGIIKVPDSNGLELIRFEELLKNDPIISFGELKPVIRSEKEIEYRWVYEDFSIKLTMLPSYFRIESISLYLAIKPIFKNYISKISEFNRELRKSYEKLPSEAGIYFFLMVFLKIIKELDKNTVVEITNFQNYPLTQERGLYES